ncbi:MAG: nucleotidyltransferase, partial [Nitrospinaceae bacterium]|nr:nucleotidyltransferase [Nitrospinaceae bacterium]
MAAGIGSRYGGLKQLEPVGPGGEVIVDYSVYDAMRAGFDHVVFVIRPDIEAEFRAAIGSRIERHMKTSYVHQTLDKLPGNMPPPPGRTKPWGTGQAALVAREAVRGPWAVINADDFYGADSFRVLADFIEQTREREDLYGMVSFILENTLSDHGAVSRGVCMRDAENRLVDVVEYTQIERTPEGIRAGE